MQKRVKLFLKGGGLIEHELEVSDEKDYTDQISCSIDALRNPQGVLVFTSPAIGIYCVESIAGILFLDPPPPDKRPQMGFRPPVG